ncbi:MAG: alpha/beta hydrolase [Pseudomonadales bacterium]|nr:alpha/beta hydrolase [Pseudomonadales bacterium]
MDNKQKIDPELVAPLETFINASGGGLNLNDIPATRIMMAQSAAAIKASMPPITGVSIEDKQIPGAEKGDTAKFRVYQPEQRTGKLPALLWIHGGGYTLGNVEGDDLMTSRWAKELSCVVVSVDYRLAPEHPFPAPLEDCYSALKWLADHADELDVDKSRIVIGGASAGGGLAAGLALLTRDRGEIEIAYQVLVYPMIDDTNLTQASDQVEDTLVWSRESNLLGWQAYLGFKPGGFKSGGYEPGGKDVPPYAAATRAEDLSNLPPAFISVGDLDLFLSENIEYAHRLLNAGVSTELHVYHGGYHAFNGLAPMAKVSRRFNDDRDNALKRALSGGE